MKDKTIVGNIGHLENEIDMAGLEKKIPGGERISINLQCDERRFPTATRHRCWPRAACSI